MFVTTSASQLPGIIDMLVSGMLLVVGGQARHRRGRTAALRHTRDLLTRDEAFR